ncbi:MAG: class I adenylate-forming enzyme family protein [Methanoregula sp.]|uniref:class I adenylate-forming enzyme family protein n=1 Tax=Methanoregula sp. TaxID=2052170 RepID=UPI003FD79DA2
MNFVDYLFENLQDQDKESILSRDGALTYRDLISQVDALAGDLAESLGRGKECLLLSENTPFFIIAYLAIIKSGNTALLVETQIADEQLASIFRECRIGAVFVQKKYRSKIPDAGSVFTKDHLPAPTPAKKYESPAVNDDDVAVVIFTSGSTGAKKGVMLTHRNLCANTESIVQYLGLTKEDRICATLPFFYCYGASLLHTHLRASGSIVLSTNIFLAGALRDINTFSCTGFAGVPSTYQILVNKTPFLREKLPTLRYMQQAGGQLPNKYIRQIAEAFPEKQFFVMYGATEATARMSYLPPALVLARLGSIGKGIPGVILEVFNENGDPVKPGETGEITARGSNIMKGYYGDPEGTQGVIKDGRLFTGDLATVDDDGYIFIIGRAKNIIKSGGYRISPNEIEEFICSLDCVSGCVVLGLPDDIMGEAVVAVVQPGDVPEVSLKEKILTQCRQHLPSYKVPRSLYFIKEFPLNASDKVDKQAIAASLRSERQELKGAHEK